MSPRDAVLQLLRERGPFRALPDMILMTLAHLVRVVVVEDGERLFEEGDEAQDAFIVLEGRVDIIQRRDGADRVRATLGPGDLFGELALFSRRGRLGGAVARGSTRLAAIAEPAFLSAVRAHPELALALLRMQADRFAALERAYRQLDR